MRYNDMETYKRLKDLREDKDCTQTEIARVLGMKQQQYSEYERGRREVPIKVYIKLAEYYDVSIDYIVGLTNDKRKFW